MGTFNCYSSTIWRSFMRGLKLASNPEQNTVANTWNMNTNKMFLWNTDAPGNNKVKICQTP